MNSNEVNAPECHAERPGPGLDELRRRHVIANFIDIIFLFFVWMAADTVLRACVPLWKKLNMDVIVAAYFIVVCFKEYLGISIGRRVCGFRYNRPLRLRDAAVKNLVIGISLIMFFYGDYIFYAVLGIPYNGKHSAEYIYAAYVQSIMPFILILADSYYGWGLRLAKIELRA